MNDSEEEKISINLSYKGLVIFGLVIIAALVFAVGYLWYTNTQLKDELGAKKGNRVHVSTFEKNNDWDGDSSSTSVDKYWDGEDDYEEDDDSFYDESIYVDTIREIKPDEYKKHDINGKIYYEPVNDLIWIGEDQEETFDIMASHIGQGIDYCEVVNYDTYMSILNTINSAIKQSSDELKQYSANTDEHYGYYNEILMGYLNKDSNYILVAFNDGHSDIYYSFNNCFIENGEIVVLGEEENYGVDAIGSGYLVAIPTDLPTTTKVKKVNLYVEEDIEDLEDIEDI